MDAINSQAEALDTPRSASESEEVASHAKASLTDSPLFWLVLFCVFALLAMVAIAPKYALRQGGIETRFQNRETTLAWKGETIESPEAIAATRVPQSSEGRRLRISLAPLFGTIGVVAVVALLAVPIVRGLRRQRHDYQS